MDGNDLEGQIKESKPPVLKIRKDFPLVFGHNFNFSIPSHHPTTNVPCR